MTNQASNIQHHVLLCLRASKEPPPSSEPSFLPGNLAGMQHGVLSVSVNFLALEPGIEKGKSQKPGKNKKNPPPNLFIKGND